MDSSQHRWLPDVPCAWWLVAMMDDADDYVYAEFHPQESTQANMSRLMHYIQRRGLFDALYVDSASHFKTTRHGGLHYEVSPEQVDTQIQRALAELDIAILYAHTPQAKGRVERLFGFFQDRLIKEMRLAGITDYTQANLQRTPVADFRQSLMCAPPYLRLLTQCQQRGNRLTRFEQA